jgi:hypothetical protein
MNSYFFWNITPCSLVKVDLYFGGTNHLHLHGGKVDKIRKDYESGSKREYDHWKCKLSFTWLEGTTSQNMDMKKQIPWHGSASKIHRLSDHRLSAKSVPTVGKRGCSAADPYGRILEFLDRRHSFFFQVVPQLYSRGWVDPVPGLLFLWKSGCAGNGTRTPGSMARNSDH